LNDILLVSLGTVLYIDFIYELLGEDLPKELASNGGVIYRGGIL
jgi:hypothetical protein